MLIKMLGCNNCKMEKSRLCVAACKKTFRRFNKKKQDAIDNILIEVLGAVENK